MAAGGLCIYAIALVGQHDQPLFVEGYTANASPTKWHAVAHGALDVFEEREALSGKVVEPYVGLLYTMDDYAVYGYQTNTRVRIVVVIAVTDGVVRDLDIKIFRAVHTAYIDAASNPFGKLPSETRDGRSLPITSRKFAQTLESIVRAHSPPA